ncbi:MAG: glycosyltransferase family 4 protein [Candidatus Omnitrophota bacterium]
MKVAIISFGHVDVTLPLAKYMTMAGPKPIEVDVYFVFSQPYKYESILHFKEISVANGLLDSEVIKIILGDEVLNYIGGRFHAHFFMYPNRKVYDPRNIFFSYGLAKCLLDRKYDVIHFNGNCLFQIFIGWFLGKLPRVHTIHDFVSHTGELKKRRRELLRLPERLNRYLVKSPRPKIVHAQAIKEFIYKTEVSARNIHTIYYGPLDIFTQVKRCDKPPALSHYILFFGRIEKYKGLSYLIDAFKTIQPQFRDLKLIIAGCGDTDDIERRVSGNADILFMKKYITDELPSLIIHSLMVVCPYIDASQSGVVQTAYAFGKPVVATRVGGLPEVVEEGVTGKLVPPGDVPALAQAISELLTDQDKLTEMSENIRYRLKEELRWEHIARQTIAVYRLAMKKNGKNE